MSRLNDLLISPMEGGNGRFYLCDGGNRLPMEWVFSDGIYYQSNTGIQGKGKLTVSLTVSLRIFYNDLLYLETVSGNKA